MKRFFVIWISLSLCLLAACKHELPVQVEPAVVYPLEAVAVSAAATPAPSQMPAPEPQPVSITIGAVGDIMVVSQHIAAALDEETGDYDFSFSFPAVSAMFNAVDIMCGNLEGALPGKDVDRYSSRQIAPYGVMRFGAPDAFAQALADAGFNFMSTANNHAADYGAAGMINTMNVLDEHGLYHTGTFRSAEARKKPCVIEVNGIRVGFVATTAMFNEGPGITERERNDMLSRIQFFDLIVEDIENCKAAGAEFIIMFAHWDTEYVTKTANGTKIYARRFMEAGVDAIFGAHPHVAQPMAYETVTRPDGSEHTGFVAYSLGNFYTNANFEQSCGLYVQLEITKAADGKVSLTDASYMPTYCLDRYYEEVKYHQMVPALMEASGLRPFGGPIDEREAALLLRARNYIIGICGTDIVPLMEDTCWIN